MTTELTKDELAAKLGISLASVDDEPKLQLITGAEIKPEGVSWVWRGWLPAGKVVILPGPPGSGKTSVAVALAACCTSGPTWPDGQPVEPADVVIWSGEDGIGDTLVPRLIACGADLSRVHFVGDISEGGSKRTFDPATDVGLLYDALAALPNGAGTIIVDPVVSAVAGDSHKNTEVRRALQPLVDLARDFQATVVGITHYSKGTRGKDPVERVTGSIAFGALARIVLGCAKLQDDHEDAPGRLLVRAKSNLGEDGGGFVFDVEPTRICTDDGEVIETTRVVWRREVGGNPLELLSAAETTIDPGERTERDDAKDFLRHLLADGPMARKDILKAAKAEGFNEPMLRRAREDLGIKSKRSGFQQGSRWSLPTKSPFESYPPEQNTGDMNGAPDLNGANKGAQNSKVPLACHSGQAVLLGSTKCDLLIRQACTRASDLTGEDIAPEELCAQLSPEDMADPEIMTLDFLTHYAAGLVAHTGETP